MVQITLCQLPHRVAVYWHPVRKVIININKTPHDALNHVVTHRINSKLLIKSPAKAGFFVAPIFAFPFAPKSANNFI